MCAELTQYEHNGTMASYCMRISRQCSIESVFCDFLQCRTCKCHNCKQLVNDQLYSVTFFAFWFRELRKLVSFISNYIGILIRNAEQSVLQLVAVPQHHLDYLVI